MGLPQTPNDVSPAQLGDPHSGEPGGEVPTQVMVPPKDGPPGGVVPIRAPTPCVSYWGMVPQMAT